MYRYGENYVFQNSSCKDRVGIKNNIPFFASSSSIATFTTFGVINNLLLLLSSQTKLSPPTEVAHSLLNTLSVSFSKRFPISPLDEEIEYISSKLG